MDKHHNQSASIHARLISLLASLPFSVLTAVFIWMGINKELMYWGGFLSSSYLLTCIMLFAVLALVLPNLFPSILGKIWRGIVSVERWWGW